MSELLTLADIVGVYGVKGWVKIRPYLEAPLTLANLSDLVLTPGKDSRAEPPKNIQVIAVKQQGKGFIAQLQGVEGRSVAEALRGWSLKAPPSVLPPAEEGEIYWRELVGLRVMCREGDTEALLGEVDYLLDTGANDVLVVKSTSQSIDDRERLIPWLPDDVVLAVDTALGVITVEWFIDA